MTRTARRRWSRELDLQVDGIAFGEVGPVLVHGYEFPAGGKWLDDVIPGKLMALDRQTGAPMWTAPCEIGYGRGFGAGFGVEGEIVVLGPSVRGHSIARMAVETGEVIGAREVDGFDEAHVYPDVCICVTARRVFGVLTNEMVQTWAFARDKERYHLATRAGGRVYVAYSNTLTNRYGILILDAESGKYRGDLLPAGLGRVHALTTDAAAGAESAITLSAEEFEAGLSPDALREWLTALAIRDEEALESHVMGVVVLPAGASGGDDPLWVDGIAGDEDGEVPAVSFGADSGKLYVAQGTSLGVRDGLTGRSLGGESVAGLDEYVAWAVRSGAALLAEETRVSVFEVPD